MHVLVRGYRQCIETALETQRMETEELGSEERGAGKERERERVGRETDRNWEVGRLPHSLFPEKLAFRQARFSLSFSFFITPQK